jgi:hypothetical protein
MNPYLITNKYYVIPIYEKASPKISQKMAMPCGKDSSGKPTARNERGLVTDSLTLPMIIGRGPPKMNFLNIELEMNLIVLEESIGHEGVYA